jgi:hypothetical protein
MNNKWVISQAGLLSSQLSRDDKLDDEGRIKTIYRRAFSREPTSQEIKRALDYLNKPELLQTDSKTGKQPDELQLRLERLTSFCQIVFASAEFQYIK